MTSLIANLSDVWEMNGAAGANEVGVKGNILVASGNPGSVAGRIGLGRSMVGATPSQFQIANDLKYQGGNFDWRVAVWVKFATLGSVSVVLCKEDAGGTNNEYLIYANPGTSRLVARSSHDGSTFVDVPANNFGNITTGVWYLVCMWYDTATSKLNISVNNSTPDNATIAGGTYVFGNPLCLGCRSGGGLPMDGVIDQVHFSKRVFTSAERSKLWNGGNGLAYADWSPAIDFADDQIWSSAHFTTTTFQSVTLDELGSPTQNPPSSFNPTAYDHFESFLDEAMKLGAKGVWVTQHHVEAFCNWPSVISPNSIADPLCTWHNRTGINVTADMCRAARQRGLKVGFYYCAQDKEYVANFTGLYTYEQWMIAQLTEILGGTYGIIDLLLIDVYGDHFWAINGGISYAQVPYASVENLVRSLQPTCSLLINDHVHSGTGFLPGDVDCWERSYEGLPTNPSDSSYGSFMASDTLHRDYAPLAPRWFGHADETQPDPVDSKVHIAYRYSTLKLGGVYCPNYSPGPSGQINQGMKDFIAEMWVPNRTPQFSADFTAGAVPTNLTTKDSNWSKKSGTGTAVINPSGEVWVNGTAEYRHLANAYLDYRAELVFKLDTIHANTIISVKGHMQPSLAGYSMSVDNFSGTTISLGLENGGLTDFTVLPDALETNVRYMLVSEKRGDRVRGEFWKELNGTLVMVAKLYDTEATANTGNCGFSITNDAASSTTGVHVLSFNTYVQNSTPPAPPTLSVASNTTLNIASPGPARVYTKVYRLDGGEWVMAGFVSGSTFTDSEVADVHAHAYTARDVDNEWNQSGLGNAIGLTAHCSSRGLFGLGIGPL